MRSKEYGVAIIGFGGMGSQHGRLIPTVEDMKLVGACDIDPKRQDAAAGLGLKAYTDLQALLSDPEVDLVIIATPNHVHAEIAIAAMRAGKHVICEKPVTLNSRELQDILDVQQETGMHFVVGQNRRWDEDYLAVKKLVDEKVLGEVFHVESKVHGSRGIPGDWRGKQEFGGGMLLDWGVHLADRILLLFPEKVKSVYCQFTHITNAEVDDGFRLSLTFESGRTALLEVGTTHYIKNPLWYVNGTLGTAVIEDWSMKGQIVKLAHASGSHDATPIVAGAGLTKTMAPRVNDHTTTEEAIPRIPTDIRDFYRNVLDAIEGQAEIIVKNQEVLRVMKLLEAAFRSVETNQVVAFE
ncbi:Gfo/Idh/MocA family protein [Gorillibacterium sp. sgz5001074]|uniref:Gfo/Idh/MocA family protein n=1 Tax=Gorillibacterium sp. sgz5001074 TaxID=3446695 RepID=UPI003F661972